LRIDLVVSAAASVFFLIIGIGGVEVGERTKSPDERHCEFYTAVKKRWSLFVRNCVEDSLKLENWTNSLSSRTKEMVDFCVDVYGNKKNNKSSMKSSRIYTFLQCCGGSLAIRSNHRAVAASRTLTTASQPSSHRDYE
jgi:hypothetical protein